MGLTTELCVLALCAFAAATLIAARDMPLWLALVLAGMRVVIPLVYFAEYFNPAWTVLDDLYYTAHGSQLISAGYNPFSVLVDSDGRDYLFSLSQGHHVLYTWWNVTAMWLFGDQYYAPVFFNVVASFAGASLLAAALRQLGFTAGYCLGIQVFWLVHWDAIAWTSLLNIKDTLVQTLTIAVLYCLVGFVCQRQTRYLVGFACVAALFWWLRFYVPVLVLTAAMLWMLTQWDDARKWLLIPAGCVAFYLALPVITGVSQFWDFTDLGYGMVRFSLTPTPWSLHEVYSYLWLPTLCHWAFFIPALLGLVWLWNDSRQARLFVFYLLCLVTLYSVTQELLGPRQRYQAAFMFAWGQFHFLWKMKPQWADQAISAVQQPFNVEPWPAMAGRHA